MACCKGTLYRGHMDNNLSQTWCQSCLWQFTPALTGPSRLPGHLRSHKSPHSEAHHPVVDKQLKTGLHKSAAPDKRQRQISHNKRTQVRFFVAQWYNVQLLLNRPISRVYFGNLSDCCAHIPLLYLCFQNVTGRIRIHHSQKIPSVPF